MKFALHRNLTVSTPLGHSIEFKKGVLTYVPPEAHDAVVAVGAIPEEELPEPQVDSGSAEPADPKERRDAVYAAFEKIILRNVREDFAASGSPSAKALNDVLGWPLSAKERTSMWVQFNNSRADAQVDSDAEEGAQQ